jgi:hypothetical protein
MNIIPVYELFELAIQELRPNKSGLFFVPEIYGPLQKHNHFKSKP